MMLDIQGQDVLLLQGFYHLPEGLHVIHPDQICWLWSPWRCHIDERQAASGSQSFRRKRC